MFVLREIRASSSFNEDEYPHMRFVCSKFYIEHQKFEYEDRIREVDVVVFRV